MNYGQVAYEGYCKSSGNKSLISSAELPSWDKLNLEIQRAWNAAAEAVLMKQVDLTTKARNEYEVHVNGGRS